MYEQKQPTEAVRIYQQIQKEDAQSPAAQTATARLSTLKP